MVKIDQQTDMIYMQWPSTRLCSLQSSSVFFMRENKVFAEITGAKVNGGAGYGLEVPCVYRLYGPNIYVDKMKALIESLLADGHYNPLCNSDFAQ